MKHGEIDLILNQFGVVDRRRSADLAGQIDWLARTGRLIRLLPSVYARPDQSEDPRVRALAAAIWDPDCVVTGAAAARLTFLPSLAVTELVLTSKRRSTCTGYVLTRRHIPPEFITELGRIRCTSPALTALDLCPTHGGDGIDAVLRTRSATLDQLWQALAMTPGRVGNRQRKHLLLESRALPWSAAERRFHALLRAAGITGWVANHPVTIHGLVYYLDVAFRRYRIAFEIDGRGHAEPAQFERDRWRQNDLVLDGWLVLRFTWTMIIEHPEAVLVAVTRALESCQSMTRTARHAG